MGFHKQVIILNAPDFRLDGGFCCTNCGIELQTKHDFDIHGNWTIDENTNDWIWICNGPGYDPNTPLPFTRERIIPNVK